MAESMRRRLEKAEDESLAPYALRTSRVTRRYPVEDEGRAFDYRTDFQRDRDRIVYSRAFRRLRQKAQAGILADYEDHRRNRLTHTLEVTQVARTIGRALRLNEDLIEAIALGHDLGQPPFGPIGERALDDLMSGRLDGRGGPGVGDLLGFHRSWQGVRVVDRLEKRYGHPGLNLTDPVREGILKQGTVAKTPWEEIEGVRQGLPAPFETQVVSLADRIASALHELDDALQAGAVDVAQVERLQAVRQLRRKIGAGYPPKAGRFMKANAIHRGLTHLLVTGAIIASEASLLRWANKHRVIDHASFGAVRDEAVRGHEIGPTPTGLKLLGELEGFLTARVHRGFEAARVNGQGRRVLLGLFAAYQSDPTLVEDHVLLRFKEAAGVRYLRDVPGLAREAEMGRHYRKDARYIRVLADYLAGMTDTFALAEHRRLMDMGAVPIPSAEQLRREEAT